MAPFLPLVSPSLQLFFMARPTYVISELISPKLLPLRGSTCWTFSREFEQDATSSTISGWRVHLLVLHHPFPSSPVACVSGFAGFAPFRLGGLGSSGDAAQS
jgi:hypothetical protein